MPTEYEEQPLPTFKIPPRTIPSDGCPVVVGQVVVDQKITDQGTTYYPHAGETVDVLPLGGIKVGLAANALNEATRQRDELTSMEALHALCAALSTIVTAWTWTDNAGQPRPQPYGRPEVIEELESSELGWLIEVSQKGETEAERKNGGAPLTAGSPARAIRRKRPT